MSAGDGSGFEHEFEFVWPQGPKKVIITGDFDDWKGTKEMEMNSDGEFHVLLPVRLSEQKNNRFWFKFIVDGVWTTSPDYHSEADSGSCLNNYITKGDIIKGSIQKAGGGTTGSNKSGGNRKKRNSRKLKIKKRVRKNKKTGERTVVSEEVTELDNDEGSEDADGANSTTATTMTGEMSTGDQTPEPSSNNVHILPIGEVNPHENKMRAPVDALNTPGPVIVSHPEEIKEFSEVRDVDEKELNERLNKQLNLADPEVTNAPEEKEVSGLSKPLDDTNTKSLDRKVAEPVVQQDIIETQIVEEQDIPVQEELMQEDDEIQKDVRSEENKLSQEEATKKKQQEEKSKAQSSFGQAEEKQFEEKVNEQQAKEDAKVFQKETKKVANETAAPAKDTKKVSNETAAPIKETSNTPAKPASKSPAKKTSKTATSNKIPASTTSGANKEKKKAGLFSKLKKLFN